MGHVTLAALVLLIALAAGVDARKAGGSKGGGSPHAPAADDWGTPTPYEGPYDPAGDMDMPSPYNGPYDQAAGDMDTPSPYDGPYDPAGDWGMPSPYDGPYEQHDTYDDHEAYVELEELFEEDFVHVDDRESEGFGRRASGDEGGNGWRQDVQEWLEDHDLYNAKGVCIAVAVAATVLAVVLKACRCCCCRVHRLPAGTPAPAAGAPAAQAKPPAVGTPPKPPALGTPPAPAEKTPQAPDAGTTAAGVPAGLPPIVTVTIAEPEA